MLTPLWWCKGLAKTDGVIRVAQSLSLETILWLCRVVLLSFVLLTHAVAEEQQKIHVKPKRKRTPDYTRKEIEELVGLKQGRRTG